MLALEVLRRHLFRVWAPAWAPCRVFGQRSGRSWASRVHRLRAIDGGYVPAVDERAPPARWTWRCAWLGLDGYLAIRAMGWCLRRWACAATQLDERLRAGARPRGRGGLSARFPPASASPPACACRSTWFPATCCCCADVPVRSRYLHGHAVVASNGGLIPWQTGWQTASADSSSCSDVNWASPSTATPGELTIAPRVPVASRRWWISNRSSLTCRSSNTALPCVRHQAKLGSMIQLFVGADIPAREVSLRRPAPGVQLKTVYSIGIRVIFDWRRYY